MPLSVLGHACGLRRSSPEGLGRNSLSVRARAGPLVGLVLVLDTSAVGAPTGAFAGNGPYPSLPPVVPEGDNDDHRKEQANNDEETGHR